MQCWTKRLTAASAAVIALREWYVVNSEKRRGCMFCTPMSITFKEVPYAENSQKDEPHVEETGREEIRREGRHGKKTDTRLVHRRATRHREEPCD